MSRLAQGATKSTTPTTLPTAARAPLAAWAERFGRSEDGPPARLQALANERDVVEVGGLWGSSQALVIASLMHRSARPAVVVASTEGEVESLATDLATFGADPLRFPARAGGRSAGRDLTADAEAVRARLQAAQLLAGPVASRPRLLTTSVLALLQPLPALRDLEQQFLRVTVGETLDADGLLRRLVRSGYVRQPLAERAGEVSLRGEILDLFPFASELPLRVELFDDEIESLRSFDPGDQRSIESFERLEVCLANDQVEAGEAQGTPVAELVAEDTLWIEAEPLRVGEQAESLRVRSPSHERALRALTRARDARTYIKLQSLPGADLRIDARSVQAFEVGLKRAPEALRQIADGQTDLIVLCETEVETARVKALFEEAGPIPGLVTETGSLGRGFQLPAAGLLVVGERELKGVLGVRRPGAARVKHRSKALASFFELKAGDLVVHAVHGLAVFVGLERLQRGDGEEEHLHLRFADDVRLYVPAGRIDLVQRYVGSGSSGAPLDRIGGTTFRRRKEKVQRGLFDLAADLIEVQAKRSLRERPAWEVDTELVSELIGTFPYEDTADQAEVDGQIADDLAGPRPMDRLLCGDVGFGKTELAVRAAFRVVTGGGQVAVLVPTTLLAQQHAEVFRERFASFPVEVDMVSCYVPEARVREILERTAVGGVDVLIGTHRILSKDVHFKRLGLIIIDEEQRFGVQHKEHFKKLRAQVDVLALTATPIPRTLHMSLSGLRDIAALTVPPPGRQEIETRLGWKEDNETIREAVLHEKQRGGQVFFMHNRVSTIRERARQLAQLVPECSFAVGHGQMSAAELRDIMEAFTRGDVDVLVATTIVENGIDIPSAGTILMDDADRFGLAELHQLRGRVGRGSAKAHCFLLIERNKPIRDVARQRLKALEEMNQLGSGFGISVKDLELRGAGNILGAEQSGHIAAVGYDMFCRLLKQTVESLQAGERPEQGLRHDEELSGGAELELGLKAFLPDDWIPEQEVRIELLRELAQIHSREDSERAAGMLRDRFGRLPDEARTFLRVLVVKAVLDAHELRRVAWLPEAYVLEYADPVALERLLGSTGVELRRVRSGVAHLVIPPERCTAASAFEWLEQLLMPPADGPRMPS